MKAYRIENWPAILLAGVCWLLGTGFAIEKVLTDGVSSVTLLVAMPVLTLCVVVLLHLGMEMIKELNPMGLVAGALAVLALGVTLPASIGSVGAASDNAVAAAGKSNGDAGRIRADYAKTQGLVDEAEGWSAKECATGKGKKCDGVTFVLNQRRASLEKLEGQIKALPPAKAAMSSESRIAWFFAKLGYTVSESDIQMALPMLPAPVLEILSAFFGLFGVRRVPVAAKVLPLVETVSKPANDTQLPKNDVEIEKLRAFFVAGDGPVTNDELAKGLGISKSEASKRVTKALRSGLVSRERLGRNVAIRLN